MTFWSHQIAVQIEPERFFFPNARVRSGRARAVADRVKDMWCACPRDPITRMASRGRDRGLRPIDIDQLNVDLA